MPCEACTGKRAVRSPVRSPAHITPSSAERRPSSPSIDSTVRATIHDGSIGDFTIFFSDRSPSRFDDESWHYCSLSTTDRRLVDLRLEELEAERIRDPVIEADFEAEFGVEMGFNPTALGKCYGLRDLCNIAYFQRLSARGVDKFVKERRFSSSAIHQETHLIGVRS